MHVFLHDFHGNTKEEKKREKKRHKGTLQTDLNAWESCTNHTLNSKSTCR